MSYKFESPNYISSGDSMIPSPFLAIMTQLPLGHILCQTIPCTSETSRKNGDCDFINMSRIFLFCHSKSSIALPVRPNESFRR